MRAIWQAVWRFLWHPPEVRHIDDSPLDLKARLAAIVESSEDAIIGKTLGGIVTSWNRAAETLFGYSAAEMIGRPLAIIIPEELRGEEDDILARVARGEQVAHLETVRRHKSGHAIDISVTVSPIRGANGAIVGASKIARDISSRKLQSDVTKESGLRVRETNVELVRAEHFSRMIAETIPGRLVYWDRDRRCRFANQRFCEGIRRSPGDVIGRSMDELLNAAALGERAPCTWTRHLPGRCGNSRAW